MVTLGKFEGCQNQALAQKLYELSLDGCNETLGDVENFGWYGLILNHFFSSYIISEDSQGFFSYTQYSKAEEAQKAWLKLETDYEEFISESEEEVS